MDMDKARAEHKKTYGTDVKQEIILCEPCYQKIIAAALSLDKSSEDN